MNTDFMIVERRHLLRIQRKKRVQQEHVVRRVQVQACRLQFQAADTITG
jgi:hypothetical protein